MYNFCNVNFGNKILVYICCLCVQGCAHVSLAGFDPKVVKTEWYNILSFKFMQDGSAQPPAASAGDITAAAPTPQRPGATAKPHKVGTDSMSLFL